MSDSLFIVIYLAIALAATAWAVYFKRNRKILFIVMGLSLLVLGFIKSGCTCSPGSVQNIAHSVSSHHLYNKEYKELESKLAQAKESGDTALVESLVKEKATLMEEKKPYKLSLAILGIFFLPLIASYFWGRVFCSGVCPLGIVQDLLSVVRLTIPRWLRGVLGTVPLAYMAYIVIAIVSDAGYVLCKYDPYIHLLRFNITPGFFWFTLISVIITMVIYRPFCSFFCPYGVLLGWIGRFSKTRIEPTQGTCTTCNLCADACPVDAIEYGDKKLDPPKFKVGKIGVLLIVLIPLWIFFFGSAAYSISGHIAPINESIDKSNEQIANLMEMVAKKEAEGKSADKFQSKVEDNKYELAQFEAKKHRMQVRSFYVGAVLGLYWGIMLLVLYEREKKNGIHVDMAKCVTCGRCNNYCPTEAKLDHSGITNFLVGHMKHRKEAHPKLKMALIVATALSLSVMIGSTITLHQGMKEQQKIEDSREGYLKMYKGLLKKNTATPELKAAYEEKQTEYAAAIIQSEKKRKVSIYIWIISIFAFGGMAKFIFTKKEYKLVMQELMKYRKKIHAVNEMIIFGGVVLIGLLIFILAQLFL